MPKIKDPTQTAQLFFVIDRSGSMSSMATEAIGGFNAFVEEQLKAPGEATLTLVQFDDYYEVIHDNIPLGDVPVLTDQVFKPRGMTALYDAIGKTIAAAGPIPPGVNRILAVLTDGQENASKEFRTTDQVQAVVKQAQAEGWEILFLGANLDAKHVAADMGIKLSNVATYAASAMGMNASMSALSKTATAYRSMSVGNKTDVDVTAIYEQDFKDLAKK